MKKNHWKYVLNALLFIDVCSVFVMGLLLAFVIPSGPRRYAEGYFLGLHRHDWADLHLCLALFLIALLALHLWLNWTWVVQSTKQYFGGEWRKALWVLAGSWLIVIFLGWVLMR